jgi:hypothetical protein
VNEPSFGGFDCETWASDGEYIKTDMPASVGGTGTAPIPGWLLRALMASWTAIAITSRAGSSESRFSFSK